MPASIPEEVNRMKETEAPKAEKGRDGKLGKIVIRRLDKIETTDLSSNPSG